MDFGQITFSFNLIKNAFAGQQLAALATSIKFYNIMARACTEIKILRVFRREGGLCLKDFRFLNFFFHLSLFYFSVLCAVVIDLPLGLL